MKEKLKEFGYQLWLEYRYQIKYVLTAIIIGALVTGFVIGPRIGAIIGGITGIGFFVRKHYLEIGKPKRVSAYVLNDQIFLIDSLLSSGHITSEQYKGLKDAILQTTTP